MHIIITRILVSALALVTLKVVADEKTPATADISRAELLDRIPRVKLQAPQVLERVPDNPHGPENKL